VERGPEDARAYAVAEGLWHLRLPIPYAAAPSANAYLLVADDGHVLVDCGSSLPPGLAGLEAALALAGVPPEAIGLLVTTHHHSDHAGLASAVIERTGCVYAHLDALTTLTEPLRELDRPAEERMRLVHEQGVPDWLADRWIGNHPAADGATPIPPADRLLLDGDVLETRAGDWVVHPTPGHSGSQLALHDAASGRVISADVAYRAPIPYLEWGHSATAFDQYVASIERVRALSPSLLLPGHGRPVDDVDDHLGAALEAARTLRDRVLALVSERRATPFAITCRLVGDGVDFDVLQHALPAVLAVLDHLEQRGLVRSVHHGTGVRGVERIHG
jgi:glyoxylase-like metal-dependent hydrolase (beta-lactamase superfamily II)